MKDKPTDEENKLFDDLTSGEAGNLLLMPIELNGKECSCIFAYELTSDDRTFLAPVAILVNTEIQDMIKMPELEGGVTEFTLPEIDIDNMDNDEDDKDDPLGGLDRLN